MPSKDLFEEANRQLVICNACRYCEGLCPVFQAIELRRDFSKGDVFYLANLCHDCRACFPACMYTPPHEFQINIPALFSEARVESYSQWAWPRSLSSSFKNSKIRFCLGTSIFLAVILISLIFISPAALTQVHTGPGSFYKIIPYWAMSLGGIAFAGYWLSIWVYGAVRCWKDINHETTKPNARAVLQALRSIAALSHLDGGGGSCTYPDDNPSNSRRFYHSLVFWGFIADLISTTLAFIYQDILLRKPPFPVLSAPVLFGIAGGISLIVGCVGLIALKLRSNTKAANRQTYAMDYSFLCLLILVSLTGMLTLILRETSALGMILTIHLALVGSLFLTAPYGKFVHGVHRSLALTNFYLERQCPPDR